MIVNENRVTGQLRIVPQIRRNYLRTFKFEGNIAENNNIRALALFVS